MKNLLACIAVLACLSLACNEATETESVVDLNGPAAPAPGLLIDAGTSGVPGADTCLPGTPFGVGVDTPWAAPAGCDGLYAAPGPYVSGVTTVQYQGQTIEVWYPGRAGTESGRSKAVYDMRDWLPAEVASNIPDSACAIFKMDAYRDLPAADGSFPVVLFSHGVAGYRMQSTFLMSHLATWGFVVASAEHPERGLQTVLETGSIEGDDAPEAMRAAWAWLAQENSGNGRFAGRIDLTKVASSGHSMGSSAASIVAGDDGIGALVALAGPGIGAAPDKPFLIMGGTNDSIATTESVRSAFDRQVALPRRYVSLDGAGHVGFMDLCLIARAQGGVLQLARDYGLELSDLLVMLATDGCRPTDRRPEEVFPLVNHYVTAHLRIAFGIDAEGTGYSQNDAACFGDRVSEIEVITDNEGLETDPGTPVTPEPEASPEPQNPGAEPLVCRQIIDCINACGQDQNCAQECVNRGDNESVRLLNEFVSCLQASGCDAEDAQCQQNACGTQFQACVDQQPGANPAPGAGAGGAEAAGIICCGNEGAVCNLETEYCCSNWFGMECKAQCDANLDLTQTCDGAEDCGAGEVCCGLPDGIVATSFASTCRAACEAGEQILAAGNACGIGDGGESIEPAPEPEPVPEPEPEPEPGVSGLDAGIVDCGGLNCDVQSNICCVDAGGAFTCEASDSCGGGSAPQACDGPEDCGGGQQCCAGFPAGASCKADCGNFELEICHTAADCRDGGQCSPCSPPGTTVNACSCPF